MMSCLRLITGHIFQISQEGLIFKALICKNDGSMG